MKGKGHEENIQYLGYNKVVLLELFAINKTTLK